MVTNYLTSAQSRVWSLSKKGLSQTGISLKLGVSRQAVHKVLNQANDRVLAALLETAEINKLDVRNVNPAKGVLLGYSLDFRSKVFVTYSTQNGVQLWYEHQGQCEGCKRREECTQKLLETAKEWEIDLTKDETMLQPTLLAEKLFSEVTNTR